MLSITESWICILLLLCIVTSSDLLMMGVQYFQRKEMEIVLARNMEFSQTITDYQRRLREGAQKLQAAEDVARRRSIEVCIGSIAVLLWGNSRPSGNAWSLLQGDHIMRIKLFCCCSVESYPCTSIKVSELKIYLSCLECAGFSYRKGEGITGCCRETSFWRSGDIIWACAPPTGILLHCSQFLILKLTHNDDTFNFLIPCTYSFILNCCAGCSRYYTHYGRGPWGSAMSSTRPLFSYNVVLLQLCRFQSSSSKQLIFIF